MKEVQRDIEALGVPFWTSLGNRPENVAAFNYLFRSKRSGNEGHDIKIKVIPEEAYILSLACEAFVRTTGFHLVYNAEGKPSLMQKMLFRMAVTQRREWDPEERKEALERQGHKCRNCQDQLKKYELDHIVPLCLGGTNDTANIQALCPECHAEKTQLEERAAHRSHTLESQFAPHLWEDFHKGPKPVEVSWGLYSCTKDLERKLAPRNITEKKKNVLKDKLQFARRSFQSRGTLNVKDLLLKKKNPRVVKTEKLPVQDKGNVLHCLDVKRCRVNALIQRDRGLPIFCPLDEAEPFKPEDLPHVDFVFVDAGAVHNRPYTGSRYYPVEVVQYTLHVQAVSLDDCKMSLKASRHYPPAELAKHFEVLEHCMETARPATPNRRGEAVSWASCP